MIRLTTFLYFLALACVGLCAQSDVLFVRNLKLVGGDTVLGEIVYYPQRGTSSIPLDINQILISEDGTIHPVSSITCPPATVARPISSVLTIDVSGSMARGGPNIALAKAAAEAWISALTDSSECAITSFDHRAFLNTDFTSDTNKLKQTLSSLVPRGGTDYRLGFDHESLGGLTILRNGKHRKVMIFLTDGFGTLDPVDVVRRAQADSITVYCVSLGMIMPSVLRTVCEQTGGLFFQNVTTIEEATMAYRRIFSDVQGARGCVAKWVMPKGCKAQRFLGFKVESDTTSVQLVLPDSMVNGATVSARSIEFGVLPTAPSVWREIFVDAKSEDVEISSIDIDLNTVFEIELIKFPVVLKKGVRLSVKVRAKTTDSTYSVGRLSINTLPCPLPIVYLTCGNVNAKPKRKTLRVVFPNGGESFLARSKVLISYEGVPPSLPVDVEVSSNAGASWSVIRQGNIGNLFMWTAFNGNFDSCLVRVTHELSADDASFPFIRLKSASYVDASISASGQFIATTEYVKSAKGVVSPLVRVWRVTNAENVAEFEGGERVLFIGSGNTLLTYSAREISAYSAATGVKLWQKPLSGTALPTSVSSTLDGRNILVTGINGDSSAVMNALTGEVVLGVKRGGKPSRKGVLSERADLVAICESDSLVRVLEVPSGREAFQIIEPGVEKFYNASFSPNSKQLVVAASNGQTSLWDVTNGRKMMDVSKRQYVNDNTYCAYSPDGFRVALESGRDLTKIYESATGKVLVNIQRSSDVGGVSDARFTADGEFLILTSLGSITIFNSFNGKQVMRFKRGEGFPSLATDLPYLAFIGTDRFVGVVEVQSPVLQQDVSDSLWRVYRPSAELRPLRFASRFVGQSSDTVVKTAIRNTGKNPILVRNIHIEGSQAREFSVSAPEDFIIAPGDSVDISYSFHPAAVGERSALVVAETNGDRITARITGPCRGSLLSALSGEYDLGEFKIGSNNSVIIPSMITNRSSEPIVINNMKITSPTPGVLKGLPAFPITLEPGGSADIPVGFFPDNVGTYGAVAEFIVEGLNEPVVATVTATVIPQSVFVADSDPTTFRSVLLPSALIPEQGTLSTGVYDVIGLFAGYSVTDNIMVQAGGALPIPNKWFGATGMASSVSAAWSVGAKVGFAPSSDWIVGGGYQYGQSYYDQEFSPERESNITFSSLWASAGYGNNDSRLNVYVGYTFKHHVTGYEGTFYADATTVGIAYDYRIAEQWKICSEAFFMRTMSFVPVTLTARYFRKTDAFEFGFTIVGIPASGAEPAPLPIVPMISWLKRW